MKKCEIYKTVIVVITVIFLSLLLTECALRIILFTNFFNIPSLKNPGRYGNYCYDEDYWKLQSKFVGNWTTTDSRRIHSILGWSQMYINENNPLGLFKESLNYLNSDFPKNKILFYGDSSVRGEANYPFQIPVFMNKRLENKRLKNLVVVDLSNGGYGIDQMLLMFKLTHAKAVKPYIIFGVLTEDLDRAIFSVRTNQKPYYVIENNKLILRGIPIEKDPLIFYAKNPPKINSYLFRIVYSNFAPRLKSYQHILTEKDENKKKINFKIIEQIYQISKSKKYPLLFVLFYPKLELEDFSCVKWKEAFLKTTFAELKIPYLDTKPILIQYATDHKIPLRDFYIPNGGHHNDLGNKVIAEALLKCLSENANIEYNEKDNYTADLRVLNIDNGMQSVKFLLEIQNKGEKEWNNFSNTLDCFRIGCRIYDGSDCSGVLLFELRQELPRNILKDDKFQVVFVINKSKLMKDKKYRLKFDIVNESKFWFEDVGSQAIEQDLII